jgi:alkanesulfonate monooxygenase SsuD/methylene tetrahydromethanopterin reductase-like flavin-dependent oxidoreductase (luciferase family)
MKIGVTLPQFGDEAGPAIETARRAEELGLDGVFCFDHLWPMGQPDRPALSSAPLLGAVTAATSSLAVGTLVARIELVPDDVLVAVFSSLWSMSGGRIIAGIGPGDSLTRDENEAFGIPFESADERRARVAAVGAAVQDRGIPVWIGGGNDKTVQVARDLGAAVNLWEGEPQQLAELGESGLEVTWGGPLPGSVDEAVQRLSEVAAAGASWAVWAWPGSLDTVAKAADLVRGGGGPRH